MADFEFNATIRENLDLHKIQELAEKDVVILVGFPSGRIHVEAEHIVDDNGKRKGGSRMTQKNGEDRETADLAAELHFGSARTPARPFLDDALNKDKVKLLVAIKEQLEKESPNWDKVGTMAVGAVQEYVRSDNYKTTVPNSPVTIEHKGSDTPLIDGGDLINSVTYVIAGDRK